MKIVGPEAEGQISSLNEVIAQYAKEKITRTVRHQWGLYVASEKIEIAWQDRLGMNNYLGVDALAKKRALSQVSMVDQILVNGDEVYVLFNSVHPNYRSKKKWFGIDN